MARKRRSAPAGPEAPGRQGRAPKGERNPAGDLKVQLIVKGTDEWADWLDRLAESQGFNRTTLVHVALNEFARARGFGEPPPRRTRTRTD